MTRPSWIPMEPLRGSNTASCHKAGIIIRIPGHFKSYRHQAKTPSSPHLGAHFGHQTWQKYWGLRVFKTVFVVILGVQKFVKTSPIKPFKTCYYWPIIICPDPGFCVSNGPQESRKEPFEVPEGPGGSTNIATTSFCCYMVH